MTHTQESLDELRRKADVVEIAEGLEIDTEGTRAEITARILAHQGEADEAEVPAAAGAEDAPAPEEEVPAPEEEVTTEEESAPEEEAAPAPAKKAAGKVSGRLAKGFEILVSTYIGADKTRKEGGAWLRELAAGKQVCVMSGKGNDKFKIKVFDQEFDPNDSSKDVSRSEGVVTNVNRFLTSKGIIPRG